MKQSLLVVEICGVLGRLHSIQGLAQSNNNAKLNYSAKHGSKAAGNKVRSGGKGGDGQQGTERRTNISGTTQYVKRKPNGFLIFCFFCFVFFTLFFTCFFFDSETHQEEPHEISDQTETRRRLWEHKADETSTW